MTGLLKQAFEKAAKLLLEERHLLASRLLAELAAEDKFDRAIARSADKLARLAPRSARRMPPRGDGDGSGAVVNSRGGGDAGQSEAAVR